MQLDPSLREATLLGFTPKAGTGEIPLAELRSLEELLEHLRPTQQPQLSEQRMKLGHWFEGVFESSWRAIEDLLGTDSPHLAFNFRSDSHTSESPVKRAKLLDLGLQLDMQSIALLVAIAPNTAQKVGIVVQVHPFGGETYLPTNLKLRLQSASGDTLQEVQSRTQDNYIQLKRFWGLPGECFNIQVALGEASIIESFVI